MQSVNVSIFACFPNVSFCVDFSLLYLWLCYITDQPDYYYSHCAGYCCINAYVVLLHLYTGPDLKSDFGPQNEHIRKRMAGQPASPQVGPKPTTRFALSGQPDPTHLKWAKNGLGQIGSSWPVLTPLVKVYLIA